MLVTAAVAQFWKHNHDWPHSRPHSRQRLKVAVHIYTVYGPLLLAVQARPSMLQQRHRHWQGPTARRSARRSGKHRPPNAPASRGGFSCFHILDVNSRISPFWLPARLTPGWPCNGGDATTPQQQQHEQTSRRQASALSPSQAPTTLAPQTIAHLLSPHAATAGGPATRNLDSVAVPHHNAVNNALYISPPDCNGPVYHFTLQQ